MTPETREKIFNALDEIDLLAAEQDGYAPNNIYQRISTLARSALALLRKDQDGWMPIETAPKDGTAIIGYSPRNEDDPDRAIAVIYWHDIPPLKFYEPHPTVRDAFVLVERRPEQPGYWEGAEISPFRATHWRPLPTSPKEPE